MHQTRRSLRAALVAAGALGVLLTAGNALAQPDWEAQRGDCEEILSEPQDFALPQVRRCAQLWESYRDVQGLSQAERERFARGFSRLHYQGAPADQSLARSALSRMGMSVLPEGDFLGQSTPATPAQAAPQRAVVLRRDTSPIHVGESSRRNRDRANDQNADGLDDYNDGNYRRAVEHFERALEHDPWHVLAKYNLACNLALLGDHEEALRHLDELSRWDISASSERMARARVDEDFVSLRDDPMFAAITGYARVQLLNGAGRNGVRVVEDLKDTIEAQGYIVESFGYDRHDRVRPSIYYRPGFGEQANNIARAIDSDDVRLVETSGIDFHVVVTYGTVELAVAQSLPRPLVQGTWDGTILSGDAEETGEDAVQAGEDAVEAIEDPEGAAQEWMPGM